MSLARWKAVFISALILVALVGLTAFLFSPWHQHNRLSRQPCSFSEFEHGAGLEPYAGVLVVPAEQCLCFCEIPLLFHFTADVGEEHLGRAPPV